MLSLLNLPKPSDELLASIKQSVNTMHITNGSKKYFDSTQNNIINSCEGETFKCGVATYLLARKEFKPYINDNFIASVGIYKNTTPGVVAHLPPHIDFIRTLNLNYIIDPGGQNVQTTLYKMNQPGQTRQYIQLESYDKLTVDFSVKLEQHEWYAINIQNYHSVNNIETQRIVFSLSFNNIDFSYFQNKYEHLFAKDWLPYVGSNHGHFD